VKRWMLGAACAMALLAAGCGSQSASREVTIEATEMKYEPSVIEAKPGETIKFTVVNKGTVDHEFESDELKFDELIIPPGKSRSVVVTMPSKPGEYSFLCDAPGHKDAGMVGKVVVK
jgi:uncharacterized cupredoxin-like copper-binding protein